MLMPRECTHLNPGSLLEPIKGMVHLRGGHPVIPEDLRHSLQLTSESSVSFHFYFRFKMQIRSGGGETVCARMSPRSIAVIPRKVGYDR